MVFRIITNLYRTKDAELCNSVSSEEQKAFGLSNFLKSSLICFFLILMMLSSTTVHALQNHDGIHDPSSIIKCNDKYWVFATGNQIYCMYSTDLVKWNAASRAVFEPGTWPAWISDFAPNFSGHFWAPECIYMNGKYYLYYSCSDTFGKNISVIGLATNVTLDPDDPNYNWVDEGWVAYSNESSPFNAIDPALFWDNNKLYLTFGSFFSGIEVVEVNTNTGKPFGLYTRIAGNSGQWSPSEAPYILKKDNYFYLFINKGSCCQGANSTYYVQVGRSTNPKGPYYDKNGQNMLNNGGTDLIVSSGNYIGPGHIGYMNDNGTEYLSFHYYDGADNGAPKLHISQLLWGSDGWPIHNPDWIANGTYSIVSPWSNMVWDNWGCNGNSGNPIAVANNYGLACQQWYLESVGYGEYKILSMEGWLCADIYGGRSANGSVLNMWPFNDKDNQKYKIERTNAGSFVFSSVNGNRVVEIPGASQSSGEQLNLWDYNGGDWQKWQVSSSKSALVSANSELGIESEGVIQIFPNPLRVESEIHIKTNALSDNEPCNIIIYNLLGKQVYSEEFNSYGSITINPNLSTGSYLIIINSGTINFKQKLLIE